MTVLMQTISGVCGAMGEKPGMSFARVIEEARGELTGINVLELSLRILQDVRLRQATSGWLVQITVRACRYGDAAN